MKKEVLIVAHHLTIGGVQKSLISALKAIDYDKYNVTLYLRKNRLDLLDYIDKRVKVVVNKSNTHYYRKPKILALSVLKSGFAITKLKKFETYINNKLVDILSTSMMKEEADLYFRNKSYDVAIGYVEGYVALFVAKHIKADKKVIFYQGSTDELHEVNAKAFAECDVISVEHEDIKNALISWHDNIDDKIVVIDNYTDRDLLRSMCQENRVKKCDNGITLCTCARFADVKGIDLAVETAKLLKEKGIHFLWYLVGDGPLRLKIERMISEYELEDSIVLTGMQKNPYPYIGASDIYVQPSYEEALSISMLESQLLAIPMVSTKTVGGVAMVKDGVNGYLSDITAKHLADTIEKLIDNREVRYKMKKYLLNLDYSKEKSRYKDDWKMLLGDY